MVCPFRPKEFCEGNHWILPQISAVLGSVSWPFQTCATGDSSEVIRSFAFHSPTKNLLTHLRQWKYDDTVEEYFVEDETTVRLKKSDLTKQIDTTEMEVLRLKYI